MLLMELLITLLIAVGLIVGDSEDALKFLQQQQVKDSTLVSSVYLDDPDFHTYRSRLAAHQMHCVCFSLLFTLSIVLSLPLPEAFNM